MNAADLLPEFIGTFVPLEIMRLEKRGGPTDQDWHWAESQVDFLGEKTDALYGGAKKGEVAKVVSTMTRVVAVMAFAEGGIEIFGHHFVAYEPQPAEPT